MLKRLTIFGLGLLAIFALAWAIVFVACENQKANQKQKEQNQPQSQPCHCATMVTTLIQAIPGKGEAQKGTDRAPCWYVFLAWPEGITAWAIILTLGAIVWQAVETRRAASGAKDAAKAAFSNAQAYVTAERARLFIQHKTLKDDTLLSFDFFAVNRGRSPAALTYYFVDAKILPSDEPLPPKPTYGEIGRYGLSGIQWILPDAEKPFHFDVPEETIITKESDPQAWDAITHGKTRVWVYGLVRYRDGLSPNEYETGFCYLWSGLKSLIEAGPEAYRRST